MSDDATPAKVRLTDGLGAWLPIATAPRNAKVLVTRFPATGKPPVNIARFSTGALKRHEFPWLLLGTIKLRYRPTHWMPLPAPPVSA